MTILSAVDGEKMSSRVVKIGQELSTQFNEPHIVLHVMNEEIFDQRWKESTNAPSYDLTNASKEARRQIQQNQKEGSGFSGDDTYTVDEHGEPDAESIARAVVENTLDNPENVTVQGRVGEVSDEVVGEAERNEVRYLIIGGRKRTPVGKAIFGSTTQSILQESTRPVVSVPSEGAEQRRSGPIVAAVDRSDRAERVVQEAAELARATDRELLVVHVLTRSDFVDLNRTDTDETDEAIPENQIRDTGADIAADQAQSVTDEFRSVGLVGDPAAQIINHAKEEDASFIVTSGRRRSSAGKVLFGSVTQSVILSAECPVLTVMDE